LRRSKLDHLPRIKKKKKVIKERWHLDERERNCCETITEKSTGKSAEGRPRRGGEGTPFAKLAKAAVEG